MPARQFRTSLSESADIVAEFTTVRGQVVSFVVRLMLKRDAGDVCVVRYDTAHGRPHMDRVNARGRLLHKEWLLGMSFSDALCYAISDLKVHHETYIAHFKETSPGVG